MEFVPVRLSTLVPDTEFGFDLYIKLSHKYLLYVYAADNLATDRYGSLKKKRLKRLFISSEDEEKYQTFLDRALDMAMSSSSDMKVEDRANVVTGAASDALTEMKKDPGSQKAFDGTQKAAKGIISVVGDNPNVLKALFDLESEDDDLTTKSAVNTASLAVHLGKAMGLGEDKVEMLGTAALLRDISITKMDEKQRELFLKPYDQFSDAEWKIYKQHPIQSVEILADKEYVSKEILDAIAVHEEKNSGEGFPNKITNLSLEYQVLSLCSTFDRYASVLKVPTADVIKQISIDELGNFDLKMINALKKIIKDEGMA